MADYVTITIQGTPINFPISGASPNWAQALSDFAVAVENALSQVIGDNDISPQTYNIPTDVNTAVNIPSLQFSSSEVRGAFIRYTVYRSVDSSTSINEAGSLFVTYNVNNATGHKWEIIREYVGDALITFAISDVGQVSYTTTTQGLGSTGVISFAAQALQQS